MHELSEASPVTISSLDTDRFKVRTARAKTINIENISAILEFCHQNRIQLLIARCATKDIRTVHAMEAHQFQLMETLLNLSFDLTAHEIPKEQYDVLIRPVLPEEVSEVGRIAQLAFSNYYGHYHSDSRLDYNQSTQAYVSWAERCCIDKSAADAVFVAEIDGRIVGFRALRMNSPVQAEFVLAGVDPAFRMRGIYHMFILAGLDWCQKQGAEKVLNSTHIANIAVQRACTRVGFEPSDSFYTFHKWFY